MAFDEEKIIGSVAMNWQVNHRGHSIFHRVINILAYHPVNALKNVHSYLFYAIY